MSQTPAFDLSFCSKFREKSTTFESWVRWSPFFSGVYSKYSSGQIRFRLDENLGTKWIIVAMPCQGLVVFDAFKKIQAISAQCWKPSFCHIFQTALIWSQVKKTTSNQHEKFTILPNFCWSRKALWNVTSHYWVFLVPEVSEKRESPNKRSRIKRDGIRGVVWLVPVQMRWQRAIFLSWPQRDR